MSTPADLLTPVQAALALRLVAQVNGIGQLRVLLHLIAHPWAHTVDELRERLGITQVITWNHLTRLVDGGLVEITGKEHKPDHVPGARKLLYRVKGASSC